MCFYTLFQIKKARLIKMYLDINTISRIIKNMKVGISTNREQITNFIDNIKKSQENLKSQLGIITVDITRIIKEVDELEKQDKEKNKMLTEVFENLDKYNKNEIKSIYEISTGIKIKYNIKKNEERLLRDRRGNLEVELKKTIMNIEDCEMIIEKNNQIKLAFDYLKEDIFLGLGGLDNNSKMAIGIKVLEAQESERKRIARNIINGPVQNCNNALKKVDSLRGVIKNDLEEGLKELDSIKKSIELELKEVKNIYLDLRPFYLDNIGLNETIQETVKIILKGSNINIKMNLKPIKTEVEPIMQVAVYRIFQEILNNIIKHSKAKNANIKLDFEAKYIILVIYDDGIGFEVKETLKIVKAKEETYGLKGILDRVEQLQGDINILSSAGTGTTYTIKLPISRDIINDN